MVGRCQGKLKTGSFWHLYSRLIQGNSPVLALANCLMWQNEGGGAPETELPICHRFDMLIERQT